MQLNWSRSQYLLAFNAAILTVGTGLLKLDSPQGDLFTAGVFAVGTLTSVAAVFVTASQHGYYRTARNRAQRIEAMLGLGELALDTTGTMRGVRRPWIGKVTNVLYVLFCFLALLNLAGTVYAFARGEPTTPPGDSSPGPSRTVETGRPQPVLPSATSTSTATSADRRAGLGRCRSLNRSRLGRV